MFCYHAFAWRIRKIQYSVLLLTCGTLCSGQGWEELVVKQDQSSDNDDSEMKILLPSMPSLYICSFLFRASEEVHRIGGHVLDKTILQCFAKKLLEKVCAHLDSNQYNIIVWVSTALVCLCLCTTYYVNYEFNRKIDGKRNELVKLRLYRIFRKLLHNFSTKLCIYLINQLALIFMIMPYFWRLDRIRNISSV